RPRVTGSGGSGATEGAVATCAPAGSAAASDPRSVVSTCTFRVYWSGRRLPGASSLPARREHGQRGPDEDLDVPPDRPVAHVVGLHRLALPEGGLVALLHLPVAGDAGPR